MRELSGICQKTAFGAFCTPGSPSWLPQAAAGRVWPGWSDTEGCDCHHCHSGLGNSSPWDAQQHSPLQGKDPSAFCASASGPAHTWAGGLSAALCALTCLHFFLRNKRGKVIKPLQFQSTVAPGTVARVEPNIKWFGEFCPNSRLSKLQNC